MNEKAGVSKVLNAKHIKILESLLKLQENRECADCKTKGPRWASVNLGIFICMQCAGIHRSLGVHISKVRSTTLDTWLPEQITFIQCEHRLYFSDLLWGMRNQIATGKQNYLLIMTVGIENFIRAKYIDKRWIPKDGKAKSPSWVSVDEASILGRKSMSNGNRQMNNNHHAYEERRTTHPSVENESCPASRSSTLPVKLPQMNSIHHASEKRKATHSAVTNESNPASRSCTPVSVKVPHQAIPDAKPQEAMQKSEPPLSKAKAESVTAPAVPPPKVDYATELFNLLCMDESTRNDANTPANANAWADFKSAEAKLTPGISNSSMLVENDANSKHEVRDIYKDSPLVATSLEKTPECARNNTINLFEKSSMLSPFSVQQQHVLSSQRQPLFIAAAAATSGAGSQTFPGNRHIVSSNNNYLPIRNLGTTGHQVPGMIVPVTSVQKYIQLGNNQQMYVTTGYSFNLPTSSMYMQGTVPSSINGYGVTSIRPAMPTAAFSVTPTQPQQQHYGFSPFTQGMFTKQ